MSVRFSRTNLRDGFGRAELLDLLEVGFEAIDPETLVRNAIRLDGAGLIAAGQPTRLDGARVWVLAIGKAAVSMGRAAEEQLGSTLAGGVCVAPIGYGGTLRRIEVHEAGHPIPDARGRAASEAVLQLAKAVMEDDVVLCLVSGGGSALLAAPASALTVDDLASTTALLLRSGASIDEVNVVRRHLSDLQGGGLARLLRGVRVRTLLLSDVVGSRFESIASGPTVPDPTTFADAIEVARAHRLWGRLPPGVRTHLERGACGEIPETAKPGDDVFARHTAEILGDNATFLDVVQTAAVKRGLDVLRIENPITGEARVAGTELGHRAVELASTVTRRTLLLGGGETTVTVRGPGTGGRSQEEAVAAAIEVAERSRITCAFLATDGADGPTTAAGAIVDRQTAPLAIERGYDPHDALAANDAYPLLEATGDLLQTGPTRTNVADVFASLIEPSRR